MDWTGLPNRILSEGNIYQGDALGSVRQLSGPAGAITLARSYEPFGKLLSCAGNPLMK